LFKENWKEFLDEGVEMVGDMEDQRDYAFKEVLGGLEMF